MILNIVLWMYGGWCCYVLAMGIYRAHLSGRLTGVNKVLALPIVLFGVALDAFSNLAVSVLFFDLPREFLVTDRFKRYQYEQKGWRYRVAKYICDKVLDVFDPTGDHC